MAVQAFKFGGAVAAGGGAAALTPVLAAAAAAAVTSAALLALCFASFDKYAANCKDSGWLNLPCHALGIAVLGTCSGGGMAALASGGILLKTESLEKLKEISKFISGYSQSATPTVTPTVVPPTATP